MMGAMVLQAAVLLFAPPGAACAGCHRTQVQKWAGNSMSRALYAIADAAPLRAGRLEFKLGRFAYTIEPRGSGAIYTVTDGEASLSAPLEYAFGQGFAGQTYVYRHSGKWYESRISFYKETAALDLTMGAPPGEPKTLEQAAGREMTQKDVVECFACHTTNSVRQTPGTAPQVDFAKLRAGVDCENCHTGAARHASSLAAGKPAPMTKLAGMSTEEQSDFCGRCHRTWADIAANGPRGVGNVRFQPYRIANSKCYDATDARIACSACHDVHAALERTDASYDGKCAACHGASRKAAACPKESSRCVSCHMPKYEIPGSHHQFTDHQIRIVRTNEKYPN